ncbi:hypothetical protein F6476_18830 [Pseudomonas umsongensis]|nr:hypothetical protein F6476_18830 [Pseudomonas umsongensis]
MLHCRHRNRLPEGRTYGCGRARYREGRNQKPVANPVSAASNNGQPVTINVLANDTDSGQR